MGAFRARENRNAGRIDLLPPERRPARAGRPRPEVVEADFVVIPAGARTSNDNRRPQAAGRTPVSPPGPAFDLLSILTHRAEASLRHLTSHAFAGLVAAVFLLVFASAGGLAALTALPASAGSQPFRVSEIAMSIDDRNGMKVLAIYGRIENVSGVVQAVPPLDVVIEGAGDRLTRSVTVEAGTLSAGEGDRFALRIPHAGGKMPKVSVSVARQDAPAG